MSFILISGTLDDKLKQYKFFVISICLQSVPVHSANCVKIRIQWHV
jgi:hypothetical protein